MRSELLVVLTNASRPSSVPAHLLNDTQSEAWVNEAKTFPSGAGLTLLMLSFFPHENIPGNQLLTLIGGETTSNQWQYAQTDGFKNDVGISSIAKV